MASVKVEAAGESVTVAYAEPSAPKGAGGLVCVDPASLPNVAKYGLNAGVMKASSGVSWAAVNPKPGVFNWAPLYNLLNQNPGVNFVARIQSGADAPQWVKDLYGTVSVYLTSRKIWVDVPQWWQPLVMQAWSDMIHAAGAEFDKHPRVVMVSATSPMVAFSEPFILGGDPESGKRLFAAGCNQSSHTAAITRCVNDTADAFPSTLVELAIHGDLQSATATGITYSWPAGRSLALSLAKVHGARLMFTDYGLGVPDTAAAHTPTGDINTEPDSYAWMKLRRYGAGSWAGPVGFQLTPNGQTTSDNYRAMAQNAIDLGGQWCETSGWGSLGTLAPGLDAGLKANQF